MPDVGRALDERVDGQGHNHSRSQGKLLDTLASSPKPLGVQAMRLVLVEWEDSHSDGVWHSLGEGIEDRALLCRSVGWLILDGQRAKVVAPHMNVQEPGVPLQGCGIMTIPASAVLRIISLTAEDAT